MRSLRAKYGYSVGDVVKAEKSANLGDGLRSSRAEVGYEFLLDILDVLAVHDWKKMQDGISGESSKGREGRRKKLQTAKKTQRKLSLSEKGFRHGVTYL